MEGDGTLLLGVKHDDTIKIGIPPKDMMDFFDPRALPVGSVTGASHVVCSPDGKMYSIKDGDLYAGPLPSKEDTDWFSTARRVGIAEWDNVKLMVFHPNGDLYVTYKNGRFFKGPKPENERIPWRTRLATKIGSEGWEQFEALFFDAQGILYAVNTDGRLVKNQAPTKPCLWLQESTELAKSGWLRLTHFLAVGPDGKLWSVDKATGLLFRGDLLDETSKGVSANTELTGIGFNFFKFLSFTKDKTVRSIISFQFLPELGKKSSETVEVIEQKIYDNRKSTSPLKHSFSFTKTMRQSSFFTHDHGFTFDVGTSVTFNTGVPLIAEGGVTVSMNMSTSHNWSLTEGNETEVTFSSGSDVEIEPGKAIKVVASVVRAQLDVPYKAKVHTVFGFVEDIEGMWKGVTHYNMNVNQEDYDK